MADRWATYLQYPMDMIRDFGDNTMLGVAITEAHEHAKRSGVILASQPDLIAWQYATYETYIDDDGEERTVQRVSNYENAQAALLTLHFDVVDPAVVVDVIPTL